MDQQSVRIMILIQAVHDCEDDIESLKMLINSDIDESTRKILMKIKHTREEKLYFMKDELQDLTLHMMNYGSF